MRRLLVISPHLDDAALSCGGSIAARVAEGDEVIVATVMSGGHDERATEDRRATSLLGAAALHLGIPDAPFRQARYRTFREIVFGDDDLPGADLASVKHALAPIVESGPDAIWAPLAVGGHIDHRLCFAAVSALRDDETVSYYEDRPYALVDDLVAIRFLGVTADPAGPRETRAAASFLRRHMVDEADRTFSEARLHQARGRLGPAHFATSQRLGGAWHDRQVTHLGGREARALVAAISAYRSQLPALFGDGDPDAGIRAAYGDALTHEARWTRR